MAVLVKGPWDNLFYESDLSGLFGDSSKLLKGAGESLKSVPKGVEQIFKDIFGSDKK